MDNNKFVKNYHIIILFVVLIIIIFIIIIYQTIIYKKENYTSIDPNIITKYGLQNPSFISVYDTKGNIVSIPYINVKNTLDAANVRFLNDSIDVPISSINGNVQVELGLLRKTLSKYTGVTKINTEEYINNNTENQTNITKYFYNKYDEINYPSSIDPYISRNAVAYRNLQNNQNFIKNRPYAIACQVDLTSNWPLQNYDNTMTNVIRSCVYGESSEPDVWTKDKCFSECKQLPDIVSNIISN